MPVIPLHVDAKNQALFTQNIVWNGMSLLLASETIRKWLKNYKKQLMLEQSRNTYFAVSGLNLNIKKQKLS